MKSGFGEISFMRYRILVQSLSRSLRSHETKVEFVEADDIITACEIAKDRNPNFRGFSNDGQYVLAYL